MKHVKTFESVNEAAFKGQDAYEDAYEWIKYSLNIPHAKEIIGKLKRRFKSKPFSEDDVRQIISESVNEGFRLEKDETLLGSMNIKFPEDMPGADYTLDIIHLMDDGDEYVVIPNNYSRSASDGNTVWIPKDQWPEFKKLINRIRL